MADRDDRRTTARFARGIARGGRSGGAQASRPPAPRRHGLHREVVGRDAVPPGAGRALHGDGDCDAVDALFGRVRPPGPCGSAAALRRTGRNGNARSPGRFVKWSCGARTPTSCMPCMYSGIASLIRIARSTRGLSEEERVAALLLAVVLIRCEPVGCGHRVPNARMTGRGGEIAAELGWESQPGREISVPRDHRGRSFARRRARRSRPVQHRARLPSPPRGHRRQPRTSLARAPARKCSGLHFRRLCGTASSCSHRRRSTPSATRTPGALIAAGCDIGEVSAASATPTSPPPSSSTSTPSTPPDAATTDAIAWRICMPTPIPAGSAVLPVARSHSRAW